MNVSLNQNFDDYKDFHKKRCELIKCFFRFKAMSKNILIKRHVRDHLNFDKNCCALIVISLIKKIKKIQIEIHL